MTFTKLESSLYRPVAAYAHRKGFRRQEAEVNFFEYKIDFYGFSRLLGATLAVELKLKKWRRAFEQALIYQLCSDFVYIAVPLITANRVEKRYLADHGIGLIAVRENGRCQRLLPAAQSQVIRPHYKRLFVEHFKRINHG